MRGALRGIAYQNNTAGDLFHRAAGHRRNSKTVAVAGAAHPPPIVLHHRGHRLQKLNARRIIPVDGVLLQKMKQAPGGFAAWNKIPGVVEGVLDLDLHRLQGAGEVRVALFEKHPPKNTKNPRNDRQGAENRPKSGSGYPKNKNGGPIYYSNNNILVYIYNYNN